MKLVDLKIGQTARIIGYEKEANPQYRQKLLAMGLTPDTLVVLERVAPMGDPIQLRVRGYDLSLRKHEAFILDVELCS
jgi:Fe2+ transport system protein FeoA